MKMSKKLKLTLMILICVLIILIGFLGIYSKKGNAYKNKLPEYLFATDLKGYTTLEFEVDDNVNTKYFDKNGKEVDSAEVTEENEKNYKKEEIPVNAKENLTLSNYKKVIDIMEERLKFLQADQYRLDLDKNTGKIVLTFEDDYPDDIKSFLQMEGKLELVDSKTEEVILTYNDFISAVAQYAALEEGYTAFIDLKLNNSGLDKINNIDKYKVAEEPSKVETIAEDEAEDIDVESETDETTTNKFKIMFDSEEISEVSYEDILLNNKTLRITTDKELTEDSEINSKLNVNTIVSKLATMGKMPVIYKIQAEEYLKSDLANYINYIVLSIIALCVLIAMYFIIRYKSKGVLATIVFIANIAIFLILIRLTKIQISLNGMAGILGLLVLNTILINNILKSIKVSEKTFSENIKNAYLKTSDAFVIMLIILVIFAFSNMTVINSMGLLMFWGWFTILIGNLILTVPMLSIVNKK